MAKELRFPNESPEYRAARAELLKSEVELSAALERVAAQRRALPMGGKVSTDYVFEELVDGAPRKVRLSELFPAGKDTLFLYSYMFGPKMEAPCPSCTSILDALDSQAHHLAQRIGVAVVAKSPIQRVVEFARGRGWKRLRLFSAHGTTYQRDYFAENESETQSPMANVFVKRSDGVHHFWGTELLYVPREGDPRHVDLLWPMWNVLDLTPGGRGDDGPRLTYG
jgi:predicted dithiol-disulfide oxidoreductase (DUF899 family)